MPGDELVPEPQWTYNHAISIDAPRSAVWPWLVQLGHGRAGFSTYEGLENLVGCRIHNLTEILPELQGLQVGDTIGGPANAKGSQSTWASYLLDGPNGRTRLLERGHGAAGKGFAEKLGFGPHLIDPIGFVMSRKMLRTVKRLAEARPLGIAPSNW